MKIETIILFIFQFILICSINGQVGTVDKDSQNKPKLAIIGTYHMGKQGSNVFKTEYDNILSEKKQMEIRSLVEKLKKFKPSKIVIECDVSDSSKVLSSFREYLRGNYQLTSNETNQIGFRLAKELGHDVIYCVDWGIFPEDSLYNYETFAKSNPELNTFLENWMENTGKAYKKESDVLDKMSVIDRLIYLNQKERNETDHQHYFDLMRIGLGDKYVGANYLSWWYGRNMKILVNIIRLTESADDRILVIYGVGHVKLLTQFAHESKFYNVIDPLKLLKN